MDRLRECPKAIERKRAPRHLGERALVLDDVTSGHPEGKTRQPARGGRDRDGKPGCSTILHRMLTDAG